MFDFLKRRPDFLIVGAQKAGTSSLESFLASHPQIGCANKKEVGFFSRDRLYSFGTDWYARQFPYRRRPGVQLFEATPEYLYYPFVPDRIFRFNPRIKLIILLRNPVERAFSAWNMFRQMHAAPSIRDRTIQEYLEDANPEDKAPVLELLYGTRFPDFHSCVVDEIDALRNGKPQALEPSFVRRGLYFQQLERFYRLFPRENILIVESSELKNHRVAVMSRVLNFLGVRQTAREQTLLQDKHVRQYAHSMENVTRKLLLDFFEQPNAKLYSVIGRAFDWDLFCDLARENRN